MRHPAPRTRRGVEGFTLLEILLALAMFGACLLLVNMVVASTLRLSDDAERGMRVQRTGEALLDRIVRDLEGIPRHLYTADRQSLPDGSTPVAEDVLFDGSGEQGGPSEIQFLSGSDSMPDKDGRTSDVTEIGYRTRPADDKGFLLDRREQFFTEGDPATGGIWMHLARVTSFELAYWDPTERDWTWGWSLEDKKALPPAVRIRFGLPLPVAGDDDPTSLPFETIVILRRPDRGSDPQLF